ncbi:putative membrane protein [Burkholderia gladioli]|uniref:Membrane protein n=1 Tax=Burkholderia gladioli TaxID=28095 RepID=A0AAW3EPF2_BURGA|nr:putative membrane protein [Burkholderia gladioli]
MGRLGGTTAAGGAAMCLIVGSGQVVSVQKT